MTQTSGLLTGTPRGIRRPFERNVRPDDRIPILSDMAPNPRVTRTDCGADAPKLRDYLEQHGNENACICPAGASVGINANAVVRSIQPKDKSFSSMMHLGSDTNIDVSGSTKFKIRIDGVILAPTVYLVGDKHIEDARFPRSIEVERDLGGAAA